MFQVCSPLSAGSSLDRGELRRLGRARLLAAGSLLDDRLLRRFSANLLFGPRRLGSPGLLLSASGSFLTHPRCLLERQDLSRPRLGLAGTLLGLPRRLGT